MVFNRKADGTLEVAIEDGEVTTAKIADGAITNTKIANNAAITHTKLGTEVLKATLIAGGAAGNHTVTGIRPGDTLVAVLFVDATDASETYSALTGEFSISADDTINNVGGTDTSGGGLVVIYEDRTA